MAELFGKKLKMRLCMLFTGLSIYAIKKGKIMKFNMIIKAGMYKMLSSSCSLVDKRIVFKLQLIVMVKMLSN